MRCQEFQEMTDSYLSDELLVETNHEVLHHLENCRACRNELAARRALLAQKRLAVKGALDAQLNPAFARRVENRLRETALHPPVWAKLKTEIFANSSVFRAMAAAYLLFFVAFGAVWFYRSLPTENASIIQQNPTNESIEIPRPTDSPAAQAVQIALRETMHAAVGDHKNCAVHFRLTEDPITLTEAAKKYGRFNKDLDKAVIAALKERDNSAEKAADKSVGKIELLDAHSCVFNGRGFAHVILRRGKKIISVLVTESDSPDETDAAIISQTDENLQVAAFGAAHHVVFVVSDLTDEENQTIERIISPSVRRHIEQTGA